MPIYAYRCSACGHAQDVLQKLSDPVLTTCPQCGADLAETRCDCDTTVTDPRWAALEGLKGVLDDPAT